MKLTRKQVREGLEQVPMDVVLMGAAGRKQKAIRPKAKEFARQLAMGETKAGAYRKAISPNAKPSTAAREGHRLAADPKVITMKEAFERAIDAQKLATPAHLRALVIERLTDKAIDESIPPAQQLKALQLLGSVTEVAAFTERREVVQVHDSQEIRQRLLESLRLAMQVNAIDADTAQAVDLLEEIRGSAGGQNSDQGIDRTPAAAEKLEIEGPPPGHPRNSELAGHPPLLSNLHPRSNDNFAMTQDTTTSSNVTITPVIVRNDNEINDLEGQSSLTSPGVTDVTDTSVSIGGVGAKVSGGFKDDNPRNTPVNDLVPSGNWK